MARYIPMAIYAPELGVHALADNNEWVNGNFPEIIIMRLLYSLFGSALLVLAVVAQAETPLSPASERYIECSATAGRPQYAAQHAACTARANPTRGCWTWRLRCCCGITKPPTAARKWMPWLGSQTHCPTPKRTGIKGFYRRSKKGLGIASWPTTPTVICRKSCPRVNPTKAAAFRWRK